MCNYIIQVQLSEVFKCNMLVLVDIYHYLFAQAMGWIDFPYPNEESLLLSWKLFHHSDGEISLIGSGGGNVCDDTFL